MNECVAHQDLVVVNCGPPLLTDEKPHDPWCAVRPPNGNPRSNWICDECRRLPENADWVNESRMESGGFELDEFQAGDAFLPERVKLINGRSKYDSDKARAVLKQIGRGLKLADAASVAGVCLQYAKQISAYWRKQSGIKLKGLAKHPPKKRDS